MQGVLDHSALVTKQALFRLATDLIFTPVAGQAAYEELMRGVLDHSLHYVQLGHVHGRIRVCWSQHQRHIDVIVVGPSDLHT